MRSNQNNKILLNLINITRYGSSEYFYKKLDHAIKKIIGHKLFTLMVNDKKVKYVERVYSNNRKIYPLLGTKPIPKNNWTKRVYSQKKEFLAKDFNEIKKLFFDYEIIESLGCGSIINVPVIYNKKILGTLNILHKEKFYNKNNIKKILPYSQLLAPYFLEHQQLMKKKKKY